ncbi:NHLP family bacteriocin export ABC transporter peptidase/permease/ATPase subunit [Lewinella sp. LCG006]|uniref:NHLP family bacteriocin export ABC transporter peptidase/permease/ATPase subunit n=1 Tax=Lewinella sp. LCG006 TaxID=3231911 RepID=UPI0034607A57
MFTAIAKLQKEKAQPIVATRVKTPTVLQMEAVECGAAALAIILGYFGRNVPLEKLRVACGVSRDGLKATNLMKGARTYDLHAKGYAKSIDKLKMMKMPVIIFWNFNHFLVLEGFTKDRVYLSDPAQGRYHVTHQEFDDSFTGVVIDLQPNENFVKGNEKKGLFSALSSRISNSRLSLVFIILTSLFLVIPGLIIPSFTKIFIDQFLINNRASFVMPLLLAMGGVFVINAALVFIQQYYLLRLETKLALATSSKFLWHILHLPSAFFTQRSAGEIGNRVALNDKIARLLSGDLANAALNVIVVLFYAMLMFSYDVLLTSIGIIVAALNVIALQLVSRARKDSNRRLVTENGKLMGTTVSGISMIETLKASGRESDFFTTWAGHLAKVMNVQQNLGWLSLRLNVIPPFLLALNTTIVMGVGALRVMDGDMTLGMLVAFLYLMNNFIRPVNQLVAVGSTLQETEGDMNCIDDVLNYEVSEEFSRPSAQLPEGQEMHKLTGSLELKNIKFGYTHALPCLIEDFSIKLEPGSRVALVGGSGSGKSTVARLVAGLYDPWEGEILFDGKPRNELPRQMLNASMAVIDQDVMMFHGTIRENIAFWDDTIPEHDIVQAAKDAMIHEVIAARAGGYDSIVAEKGTNFSGGQRQRMEIARSLVLNPSILVMDEATSALDPKSEKIIMDNVRKRGCTCLIVAHRLSTIRDCDEIIVMKFGKIAERGTHEELVAKQGLYAELISSK